MPLPSHRLDLLVVPLQPDIGPNHVRRAFDALVHAGILDPQGGAAAGATDLVPGGFVRVRVDDPGGGHLYGNQAGGFRARCPECSSSVVDSVHAAIRQAGVSVRCPQCEWRGSLNDVAYTPPAAFAVTCLWIHDVGSATLTDEASRLLQEILGGFRVVFRRP